MIIAKFVTTTNPTMKTLTKMDHVHEDCDDHCSASGSGGSFRHAFLLPLYNLLAFKVCFGLDGVAASSLAGLYDLVSVFVVSPFCGSSHVLPTIMCYSVKIFHVGLHVSLFVHEHLVLFVLEAALHDRSVIVLLCGIQVISRSLEFFVILQSSPGVDSFGYSSMLTCGFQGRT